MARRTSRRGMPPKAARMLDFLPPDFGQSSPQHCPPRCPQPGDANPLGAPLSVAQVAALIGCSPWTVRQKYLPLGLPHFRVGPTGKLLFYKTQVIRWLMRQGWWNAPAPTDTFAREVWSCRAALIDGLVYEGQHFRDHL